MPRICARLNDSPMKKGKERVGITMFTAIITSFVVGAMLGLVRFVGFLLGTPNAPAFQLSYHAQSISVAVAIMYGFIAMGAVATPFWLGEFVMGLVLMTIVFAMSMTTRIWLTAKYEGVSFDAGLHAAEVK